MASTNSFSAFGNQSRTQQQQQTYSNQRFQQQNMMGNSGQTLMSNNNRSIEQQEMSKDNNGSGMMQNMIKRLGTFPKVQNAAMGQVAKGGINNQQDTSPMRVTLNLWEAPSQTHAQSHSEDRVLKTKEANSSHVQVQQQQPSYGKGNTRQGTGVQQQTMGNRQSHSQHSSAANKYEQMAQQFSLESLIKQANQKRESQPLSTQEQQAKISVHYTKINNKIDHFGGDNDQVDEEFESSAEKSKSLSPGKQMTQRRYEVHSPDEDEDQEEQSEDYGLSSESKQNRLSLTPNNCNMTSGRSHNDGSHLESNNRIFSDLSAKVVNINNGGCGPQLLNPFQLNIQPQQLFTNPKSIHQPQLSQSSNIIDHNYTTNEILQVGQRPENPKYTNSELCNYDSIQINQVGASMVQQQNKGQSSITPFDMLKQEYMQQRSQVFQHYQDESVDEQQQQNEEDSNDGQSIISLEQNHQQQSDEEYQSQQEDELEDQEIQQEELEAEDDEVLNNYDTNQFLSAIEQPCYNQLEVNDQQKLVAQYQTLKNPQQEDNRPSEATQQFIDHLKSQPVPLHDQISSFQKQPLLPSQQTNNFLTFDDFLSQNQSFTQQQQVVQQKPQESDQTSMKEYKMDAYKSPRLNADILQRENEKEQKKKREIEMLKQKAKEKEQLRLRRLNAAILIQSWVRGNKQRTRYVQIRDEVRAKKQVRRMLSFAYYRYRQTVLHQLLNVLTTVHQHQKSEQDALYQEFLNHCVSLIQKNWRGYHARSQLIPRVVCEYKFQRQMRAVIRGWKIRKIMGTCREVIQIKRDLNDIQQEFRKAVVAKDQQGIYQARQYRRKKIDELCKVVPNLFKNGRWIFSQQKLLQNLKSTSKNQKSQSNQQFGMKPYNPQGQSTKSQYLNGAMSARVQQTEGTTSRQIDFDQYYNDTHQQYTVQKQQPEEVFWPSQKQEAAPVSILWPSQLQQQRDDQQERQSLESSVVMWPSQRQLFETTQKTQQLFSDRGENEVPPISQRTAIGDKLQQVNTKTKQQLPMSQQDSSFNSNRQPYQKRTPNKQSPLKKHFQEDEDERPIKPSQHREHEPLLKKNPVFDEEQLSAQEEQVIPAQKAKKQNIDDMPIKKQAKSVYNTNDGGGSVQNEDSMIKPPGYNFEELLEKALQEQPHVHGKNKMGSSAQKRSKTVRDEGESDPAIESSDTNGGGTKKHVKKANLQKRQKYDPRKAIEEAKKKEQDGEGSKPQQAKSAFPDGFLQPVNDVKERPKTSKPTLDNDDDNKSQTRSQKQPLRRKTQKQAQQDYETQQQQQDNEDSEQVPSTANATSSVVSAGAPKNFLKRKNQAQPQIQSKVTWKVQSRIDCWTNNKDAKSTNQSQTRRKTSALRSPKQQPLITAKAKEEEQKATALINQKTKNLQQTPPPLKKQASQVPPVVSQQQQNKTSGQITAQTSYIQDKQQDMFPPKSSISQKASIQNSYINPASQSQQQQITTVTVPISLQQLQKQAYLDQNNQGFAYIDNNQGISLSNLNPSLNKQSLKSQYLGGGARRSFIQDETVGDNESIPDENDQVDTTQHSNLGGYQEDYDLPMQYSHSQANYQVGYQGSLPTAILPQFNSNYQTTQSNLMFTQPHLQTDQQLNNGENVTLQLEELEKVFEMFHPKLQTFEDCEIQDSTRDTIIPHMSTNSMFFSCYSDDIYDTILDDLREHYLQLCNE